MDKFTVLKSSKDDSNISDFVDRMNDISNMADFSEYISYNGLHQELCKYENYLFDFFRNESDEIEKIYSAIRTNSFPYNKISHFIDISVVSEKYISYFVGFTDYACKLAELLNSGDVDYSDVVDPNTIKAKNEKIANADDKFLKSLFDTTEDNSADINTAMKNIEYALSSDNYIRREIEDRADCVYYKLKDLNNHNEFTDAAMEGLKLYYKSIRKFYLNYISLVKNTYTSIIDSLNNRTPGFEKEIKKYQLF